MSDTVNVALSRCFTRFDDRAEKFAPQQIIDTFVAVGPLLDVLANRSSQIIYGRRGVGKTHALRYFESQRDSGGDIAIYIDCSNLGSNNSIYNDPNLTLSERSTRLLIDMCICMHQAFLEAFTDPKRGWSLSDVAPLLNDFTSAITDVTISGTVAKETNTKVASGRSSGAELGGKLSRDPEASLKLTLGTTSNLEDETKEKREGEEKYHVNFNYLMSMTTRIAEFVSPKRVWLLLDEWSTVANDLQPYLADLVRRSFFSIANVSVKIAAIEQRSSFKLDLKGGGYLGIELGADAAVALNLDDYLVYDVNKERSVQVFRELIRNHIVSISKEDGVDLGQAVYNNWPGFAFTQEPIFVELVKASEGVPRDAMHILSTAAQRNFGSPITAPALRAAALQFFQTEKYTAISANHMNRDMLDWIRFKVIDQRNTRAFLLRVGAIDPIIDRLFDLRALHILNRSMSAAHKPGERYVVYKLDYGCYVDLTNTDKFPDGGLIEGDPSFEIDFNVPDDDARSYRRAILDLKDYYLSQSPSSGGE